MGNPAGRNVFYGGDVEELSIDDCLNLVAECYEERLIAQRRAKFARRPREAERYFLRARSLADAEKFWEEQAKAKIKSLEV